MRYLKLIIAVILLFTAGTVSAQQRYANQFVASVSGGYVPSSGYNTGISIEKYLGSSFSSIKLDLIYLRQNIDTQVKGSFVKTNNYGAAFPYNYSLEKYLPYSFYINLSAGLVGMHQQVVFDYTYLEFGAEDKFVYGPTAGIQFELPLNKNLSFFVEPKMFYLMNSDVKKFCGSLGGGVKVYL